MIFRWQRRRHSSVPRLCTTFWATSARTRQCNTYSPLLMTSCRRTRPGLPFSGEQSSSNTCKCKSMTSNFFAAFLWRHHLPKICYFTRDYSRKRKESVWAAFLNLLNRPDGFIQNMTSRWPLNLVFTVDLIFCSTRVVAKMACWSPEQMQGSDLQ